MKIVSLFLICISLLSAAPARADRDIVYAARYYAPPGSGRTSHFHLYRINPDGTGRTQLTFGQTDDDAPLWSPDGRRILFQRGDNALCMIPARGGLARTLLTFPRQDTSDWGPYRWLPDGRTVAIVHSRATRTATVSEVVLIDCRTGARRRIVGATDYRPSPDEQWAYLPGDAGDRLWAQAGNQFVPVADPAQSIVWLDGQTLIGLAGDPDKNGYFLRTLGTDGHEVRHLPIRLPDTVPNLDGAPREDFALLKTTPAPRRRLVYALNNHNSTIGVDWVYLTLNPADGTTRYLTEGQFLAWSPDSLRFCTAPGRDTVPYQRYKNGNERTVWAAPLYIRAASGGPMRAITPPLSWITWADWRQRADAPARKKR